LEQLKTRAATAATVDIVAAAVAAQRARTARAAKAAQQRQTVFTARMVEAARTVEMTAQKLQATPSAAKAATAAAAPAAATERCGRQRPLATEQQARAAAVAVGATTVQRDSLATAAPARKKTFGRKHRTAQLPVQAAEVAAPALAERIATAEQEAVTAPAAEAHLRIITVMLAASEQKAS
jgi:hypothetical protein